jgi:hypothetical protein
MGMQHLDGRLLLEAHVLAEVDLGVATLTQQADQPVVAKLSTDTVDYGRPPIESSFSSNPEDAYE